MHLAVASGLRAVGIEYDGGIVVQPGGAALKERCDHHHSEPGGQRGVECHGLGGVERYGAVKFGNVFGLTEVGAVVQLLIDDEAGAAGGEHFGAGGYARAAVGGIGAGGHLYDTCR